MYGDNTTCDACGDVFDTCNSAARKNHGDFVYYAVVEYNGVDNRICSTCSDLSDDEIKDRLTNYD